VTGLDPIRPATGSLVGYASYGARYTPGARYFTLVSLAQNGEAEGGSADVCRHCVAKVAMDALHVVANGAEGFDQVTRYNRQSRMDSTAVEACGPAPSYDIEGADGEPPGATWCADCGLPLV
jgi:hypothetical protein